MDKKSFYDLLSENYDLRYSDTLNKKMRMEEEKIINKLPLGLTLDIGCGTGYHSNILKNRGHKVVSTDISFEMIKKAKTNNNGDFFLVADMENLPFKTNTFDNVISIFGALNHANITKFKIALDSCLKKEGFVIFTVGNSFNIFWIIKNLSRGNLPLRAIKKRKGKISTYIQGKKRSVRIRYYSRKEIEIIFNDYSFKLGSLYPKLIFLPILNNFGRYIVFIGQKAIQ